MKKTIFTILVLAGVLLFGQAVVKEKKADKEVEQVVKQQDSNTYQKQQINTKLDYLIKVEKLKDTIE